MTKGLVTLYFLLPPPSCSGKPEAIYANIFLSWCCRLQLCLIQNRTCVLIFFGGKWPKHRSGKQKVRFPNDDLNLYSMFSNNEFILYNHIYLYVVHILYLQYIYVHTLHIILVHIVLSYYTMNYKQFQMCNLYYNFGQ